MMRESRWNPILAFMSVAIIVGSFQNCSRVGLEEAPAILPDLYLKAQANFCFQGAYQGYTLDTFYAVNLNLLNRNGIVSADTDIDGISDKDEAQFNSDPLNRRSLSNLMDKVCVDMGGSSCESQVPNCDSVQNYLGVSGCEIDAYRLSDIPNGNLGIDADKDGILDVLEILRGTIPGSADALEDPDHDYVLNNMEIFLGTNPLYHDTDTSPAHLVNISATQEQDSACSGESWDLKINRVPMVRMPAFEGSQTLGQIDSSRGINENMVLMVLILKPISGTAPYLYLHKFQLVSEENLSPSLSIDQFYKTEVAQ